MWRGGEEGGSEKREIDAGSPTTQLEAVVSASRCFNALEPEINVKKIYKFSSYFTENALSLHYKSNRLYSLPEKYRTQKQIVLTE